MSECENVLQTTLIGVTPNGLIFTEDRRGERVYGVASIYVYNAASSNLTRVLHDEKTFIVRSIPIGERSVLQLDNAVVFQATGCGAGGALDGLNCVYVSDGTETGTQLLVSSSTQLPLRTNQQLFVKHGKFAYVSLPSGSSTVVRTDGVKIERFALPLSTTVPVIPQPVYRLAVVQHSAAQGPLLYYSTIVDTGYIALNQLTVAGNNTPQRAWFKSTSFVAVNNKLVVYQDTNVVDLEPIIWLIDGASQRTAVRFTAVPDAAAMVAAGVHAPGLTSTYFTRRSKSSDESRGMLCDGDTCKEGPENIPCKKNNILKKKD